MSVITEIVTLKSVASVTKAEFISIVDGLEKEFHTKQEGLIDSELLYDEENFIWIMVLHWKTMEQFKAASEKMHKNSVADTFVKSLKPESVKMTIASQVKTWKQHDETI